MRNSSQENEKFSQALQLLEAGKPSDTDFVRQILQELSVAGRDDATHYLGLTYEQHGDFEKAAEYYLEGLQNGYRRSIYRLALLHGGKLLNDSDEDFYFKTIKALAREGHLPSLGKLNRERLRGSFGLVGRATGLFLIAPLFARSLYWAFVDQGSWRFHT